MVKASKISLIETEKSLNLKNNQGRLATTPTLTTNELFRTGPIYQASSNNSGADDSSSINMVTMPDYIESDESAV